MTERPLSITTQIATPIHTTFNSAASVSANDALPVVESVDEEPYTIKCICDFSDDDGNTIFCENCETWQHIECFYPGRVADASKEEFDHSCADCKPRPLDRRHATERQRHQRQNKASNDGSDKKTKRPPSKSHKKKSRPSDLQVNGIHDHDGRRNGSPQDHPHTKKKGHRSNQSINSTVKRSPPFNSRPNTHGHPPSPAHTPPDLPVDFQVHSYSDNFLSLYDDDEDIARTTSNSYENLTVTNTMAEWLRDSGRLHNDTGIDNPEEVFQVLRVPVDNLKWPELVKGRKVESHQGLEISWRYLYTPHTLSQTGRIAELNGVVGFQKDYCDNPENQWAEMAHPRPLIFFHPRLPLCIDTRREGSKCRYVRRSCRPNTTIETFLADNNTHYHFWLVSERPLEANEQITLPWDFRFPAIHRARYLHLLNLGDEDGNAFDTGSINEEEYNQLTPMVNSVLSDHGGCACDLGNDCAFARFHRNYHGRSHIQSNAVKSKKGRRPKQTHVSPTSTGHATNSRAASEGHQDHGDEDDNQSISGSSRGKPHSRDLTPLHGVGESNGILTGPTEREKRKLQMVEDSFKKLDQPPRKKKRASDGSNANSTTMPQSTSKPRQRSVAPRMSISHPPTINSSNGRSRQYVDTGTSGRLSGSPFSAVSPTAAVPYHLASRGGSASRRSSTAPKSAYVDSSTQTEDSSDSWWKQTSPKPKRTIVPLAKRLLRNRQRIKAEQSARRSEQPDLAAEGSNEHLSPVVAMDIDMPIRNGTESPLELKDRMASISSSTPSIEASADVHMVDTPAILISNSIKPPPPPWSGHPNNVNGPHASGPRSPDLRVQMPPAPNFTTPNMSGPLSASGTPSSAVGSLAQSPHGTVHFPGAFLPPVNGVTQHASPIKTTKKMSLSDYASKNKRKKTDSAHSNHGQGGSSPSAAPAVLKPSLSTVEEAKAHGMLEGSAIVDSPMMEKTIDPMSSAPTYPPYNLARNNPPTNGTL